MWRKSNLKRLARLFSSTMPSLIVWVCHKHAYELITDPTYRPELGGFERHKAMAPIVRWEPDVLR
jgi:hypothetical protein